MLQQVMAQILLHLSDYLAERLAPFQEKLPELLERGLQDVLDQPTQDNPEQEAELDQSQQHAELFRIPRQIRTDIQAKHGTYQGDLLTEARCQEFQP
ncbi:hypothetical protein C7293_19530 [filamentous cyanobacterium CCT1]|nr:hypothetical protein C7293_19530 [filamentous cyanobacterium CCT1]PSN79411.1 hypothetical protein C8B47_11850 [filamentous cyanobacterium CCP4]